jgi:hypothetical protein
MKSYYIAWDITPCSPLKISRLHGVVSQKIKLFILFLLVYGSASVFNSSCPHWLAAPSHLTHDGNSHSLLTEKSKSESVYDWWSVGKSVSLSVKPLLGSRPDFYHSPTVPVLSMCSALSYARIDLSFVMVIVSSTWHLYAAILLHEF